LADTGREVRHLDIDVLHWVDIAAEQVRTEGSHLVGNEEAHQFHTARSVRSLAA
jgi:hypothetical protein